MPFEIVKAPKGYFVKKEGTSKTYSKKPLTKTMAMKQMRALYANVMDTARK
jgi:hypothetical protein